MKSFLALPVTILSAIEASNRRITVTGKMIPDSRVRKILEGVLATGKPNLTLIEARQKGLFE